MNGQMDYCDRARASIQQLLNQHAGLSPDLQFPLQHQLAILTGLQHKLSQGLIQVAAFGWVGRGKSAVLNALFSESVFPVGLLNGETQWPRSVRWSPTVAPSELDNTPTAKVQIELIDTPGLDEIEDQGRAQMARDIAQTADLILFIVAGPPTSLEIEVLKELQQVNRPLLMVVNKADLHPHLTVTAIHQSLGDIELQQLLSPQEILLTAAAPAPVPIRVEWSDGRTAEEWETPPPQVAALRSTLLGLLHREGGYLLAMTTLLQAQAAEKAIAQQIGQSQMEPAATLIWQFVQIKALILSLNPLMMLDLWVGSLCDLLLIGALVKCYGLPPTRHRVGVLWQTLFVSFGILLLTEMGGLLSGLNIGPGWSQGLLPAAGTLLAQAGAAAYGAYRVGQTTQTYLVQGCTWGPCGPSTILQNLVRALKPDMVLFRLKHRVLDPISAPELSAADNQ